MIDHFDSYQAMAHKKCIIRRLTGENLIVHYRLRFTSQIE